MTTTTAIYARFSSDKQDARSIEDQERRCRRYAEVHGFEVARAYSDEALSGATLDRPGLKQLLEDARRGDFKAVLVDDQSRLSRDLTDYLNLKRTLAARGVEIINRATGRSSRERSSRLQEVVEGYMHEQYLVDLGDKTHRGQEGRARSGFWVGGRCFGYDTKREPNPPDPAHVRKIAVINEREAEVVRRIFEECASGATTRQVADGLNRDCIAAPYDPKPRAGDLGTLAYSKPAGRGWGCGTVRSILRNERYIGMFVWNKRKWVRDPETRKHRAQARPEAEWISTERPDLAIIDKPLWRKAQTRLGPARPKGAPKKRMGYRTSPLSGLLRCGVCGAGMQIAGRGFGGKEQYRNFKCAANHSKGSAICASSAQISEGKVTAWLASSVREVIERPRYFTPVFDRFATTFARILAEQTRLASDVPRDGAALARELHKARADAQKIADTLLAVGVSDTLKERLAEAEARVRTLEARRAATATPTASRKAGPPVPSPERLRAMLLEVAEALAAPDSDAANRVLRAGLEPIVLTPGPEEWAVQAALKMNPAALVGRPGSYATASCGGRI